jgi:DnaJ-domain-containing protein 1
VTSPSASQQRQATGTEWPEGSLELARELQRSLVIGDRDWHALKGQRPRRAAEQLAAALVQLLAADHPAQAAATPARQRAIELIDHGLAWLRAEVSDPGCPSHGRGGAGRRAAS